MRLIFHPGILAGLLIFISSTTTLAESVIELACAHVVPIQLRFVQRHVSYSALTPELEKRTIAQFMKRADPSKSYLLESDMKAIEQSLQGLFMRAARGDCHPIEKANEIFVQRASERIQFAHQYLGADFKLDKSAKFIPDPDHRQRAKSTEKANAAFTSQLQWEVANYVSNDLSLEAAKKHVLQVYDRFLKRVKEVKTKDVLASYLDTFASALDPHSNYMPPDSVEDFEISMRLSLDGIGATLAWRNGFTSVEEVVPGGAAFKSGLIKRHDKILAVAQGDDGAFVEVLNKDVNDVVRLIRGPKGTLVRLRLLRREGKEKKRLEVRLVRDKVQLEDAAASIYYIDREVRPGKRIKVALLNLPSFYHDERPDGPSATSDLKRLLGEAAKNRADAVVLDLAGNGGGSMTDAVDVAGLFLASGNILRVGMREDPEEIKLVYQTYADSDADVQWSGPLVVLTSRETASASEIVTGALKDYHRAVIVGADHTFGKGTMQTVEGLIPGLGATKITRGMFFTAGGLTTQHRGVSGDVVFPSLFTKSKVGERWLDYSLPPQKISSFISPTANLRDVHSAQAWTPIDKPLITKLLTKSKARIEKSADFKKIAKEIKKSQKEEKYLLVGSLFKDSKSTKSKGVAKGSDDDDDDEDKEKPPPSKEERTKAYLARADVVESVNIAADLALELLKAPRHDSDNR